MGYLGVIIALLAVAIRVDASTLGNADAYTEVSVFLIAVSVFCGLVAAALEISEYTKP